MDDGARLPADHRIVPVVLVGIGFACFGQLCFLYFLEAAIPVPDW